MNYGLAQLTESSEKRKTKILSFSVFILPAMLLLSIGRKRSFTPVYFNFWMMVEPLSANCIHGQGGVLLRAAGIAVQRQCSSGGGPALESPRAKLCLAEHLLEDFHLFPAFMSLFRMRARHSALTALCLELSSS